MGMGQPRQSPLRPLLPVQPAAGMEGFRLQVLETYNWCAFNGLARLGPLGGSALLTRANTVGATILLDALLMLMVLPGQCLYNRQQGEGGRCWSTTAQ
jgi:uncharacterized protein YPO0396